MRKIYETKQQMSKIPCGLSWVN